MSYLPCKNPNCKSEGRPHPNCHCYGGLAKGGEVKHFCESNKEHLKECKYYADGGDVDADTPVITPDVPETEETPTWNSTKPVDNAEETPTWDNTTPLQEEEPTFENTTGKYETPLQQAGAGIEGLAQGYAGPLATLAEKGLNKVGVPGLTDEDITGRQAANPITYGLGEAAGLGAGLLTGTGVAGVAAKGARLVGKAAGLAKAAEATTLAARVGATALNGAIENGVIQGSDEVSKAMLGRGNQSDAVSGILTSGLIGGAFGGLGGAAGKGLEKLGDNLEGTKLHSWLAGVGDAAQGNQEFEGQTKSAAYKLGKKFWDHKVSLIGAGAGYNDLKAGYERGDMMGGIEDAMKDVAIGATLGLGVSKLSKPASALLLKAISDGEQNPRALFQLMDYANKAEAGAQKMNRAVGSLFKIGGQQVSDKYDFETGRSKLDKYIEDGGADQEIDQMRQNQNQPVVPGFAEGGEVKQVVQEQASHPIATVLPEQHAMLTTAKGRVSSYLRDLRPKKDLSKLAFDSEPDQTDQKRSYKRALNIALQPLSILDKIDKGTIEPEHLRHFNAMYPEINEALHKKITEKITDAQMKGQKPSYKVRQGLSMLLGTNLSSEMQPQNIQAAQAVFQMQAKPQQAEGQGAPKKNSAKLSKSSQSFLTGSQSLVGRQQRQS